MNEVEAKRKEDMIRIMCKIHFNPFIKWKTKDNVYKFLEEFYVLSKQDGVEMARKEIIDLIKEMPSYPEYTILTIKNRLIRLMEEKK